MRSLLKKYIAPIVIVCDLIIFRLMWVSGELVDFMMTNGKPCSWTLHGAKCGACGGTHCVKSLSEGDVIGAFVSNPMIFLCIIYLGVSVILINLAYVFKIKKVTKLLKVMYSEKMAFIILGMFIVYTILRNIPLYISWFS